MYEYRVQSRVFTGTRRSLDHEGKITSAEFAEKAARALPVGASVTAYYDPADPSRSLLTPGVPRGGVLGVVFGVLLIAAGLFPFVLAWRIRVYRANRRQRAL